VVLVTGGGTGLGKGMSLKFSQLGAKVRMYGTCIFLHEELALFSNTVIPGPLYEI
jgi:NAD(P)-dependent dehydrogenase (short-subunit alcohol dehydrogenase family)